MKFLIDAQLPPTICDVLHQIGFEAVHVNTLAEGDETPDRTIVTVADTNEYMVVTKDSDFYYSHMINDCPRKLPLITTGNIKNSDLFDLIRSNSVEINALIKSCSYIEMSNEALTGHR